MITQVYIFSFECVKVNLTRLDSFDKQYNDEKNSFEFAGQGSAENNISSEENASLDECNYIDESKNEAEAEVDADDLLVLQYLDSDVAKLIVNNGSDWVDADAVILLVDTL